MSSKTAKLFVNGGSQAVRLPAEFRFKGSEVYIRRDQVSGEVILSTKTGQRVERFLCLARRGPGAGGFFGAATLERAAADP